MNINYLNYVCQHCAYDNCTNELLNAHGGVFCVVHETAYGALCRIRNCTNQKITGTQTCRQHQESWYSHLIHHGRQRLQGFRRVLQRPAENLPWVAEGRNPDCILLQKSYREYPQVLEMGCHMMKTLIHDHEQTFSQLLVSTVWRRSVLLVE